MISKQDIFLLALVLIYLAAVAWYLRGVILARKRREESKHTAHRSRESSSSETTAPAKPEEKTSSRRHSHRRAGKRCPQCKNMIDRRRTICQHCGFEFEPIPGLEPHPDEIKSGRRKPLPPEKPPTE